MPTTTRTVVFTDLQNFTAKVAGTDREGLHRILKAHEDLVTPIVKRHHGRVVKNLGDSFMCLFPSATDSLRAAIDIQEMVMAHGGQSIRIGMTTGDVEELDGDAFGESVNLAARILSKTPATEIWFGTGTLLCMNEAEIPWEPVGRFRLKGIPGEQAAYRAVPSHKAWLPDAVAAAVKTGNLVRLRRGSRPPLLPPDPIVLLEGFRPGSAALEAAVDTLPVLNPASLVLAAYNISASDRQAWIETGRGLVIGTPEALEAAIQDTLKTVIRSTGSDTIVIDVGTSDLDLVMCGLALPAVPLSDVVSSYSYDLHPDGRWVNRSDRSVLRVEASNEGVYAVPLSPGVSVNGRSLGSGERALLTHGSVLATPQGRHVYHSTGRGYLGLILADTEMRLGVTTGQTAELGREPNHPGLAFPDRRGQDNIRWCGGARAARARAGGFTLDRALAGRRQAAVRVDSDGIRLTPLHPRCPTYVVRGGSADLERAETTVGVEVDDLIVAGTTIVGLRAPE